MLVYQTCRRMSRKEMKAIECEVILDQRRGTVIPTYWKEQWVQ